MRGFNFKDCANVTQHADPSKIITISIKVQDEKIMEGYKQVRIKTLVYRLGKQENCTAVYVTIIRIILKVIIII